MAVKTYVKDIDAYGVVCGFSYLMLEREVAGMNAQNVLVKGKQIVPVPMALVAVEGGFVIGPVEKMRPVWDDELESQIRAQEQGEAPSAPPSTSSEKSPEDSSPPALQLP